MKTELGESDPSRLAAAKITVCKDGCGSSSISETKHYFICRSCGMTYSKQVKGKSPDAVDSSSREQTGETEKSIHDVICLLTGNPYSDPDFMERTRLSVAAISVVKDNQKMLNALHEISEMHYVPAKRLAKFTLDELAKRAPLISAGSTKHTDAGETKTTPAARAAAPQEQCPKCDQLPAACKCDNSSLPSPTGNPEQDLIDSWRSEAGKGNWDAGHTNTFLRCANELEALLRDGLNRKEGVGDNKSSFSHPAVSAPIGTGVPSQGQCDTTMTERFDVGGCDCPTYEGNLRPCAIYLQGSNGRCVYCDHTEPCHAKVTAATEEKRIYNRELHELLDTLGARVGSSENGHPMGASVRERIVMLFTAKSPPSATDEQIINEAVEKLNPRTDGERATYYNIIFDLLTQAKRTGKPSNQI